MLFFWGVPLQNLTCLDVATETHLQWLCSCQWPLFVSDLSRAIKGKAGLAHWCIPHYMYTVHCTGMQADMVSRR